MLLLCSVAHCDNLAEILVGGLELFCIDDCHHNVLGFELTLSGLLIILAHIFNGKVCVFKVALEICAEGLKLLVEPVDLHVNLCGDDIAVNFNFRIVDDFLKDEVGALVLCSFGGALFKIAANVSGVFVNGGAFGNILNEFIIQFGNVFFGDCVNLDLENNGLARKVFRMVILGEGDVDVTLVADVHADHLLFKSGNEGAGTDFELIAFGSAAFELLIAHESRKIEGYDIALTNGTILNGCFGCHLVELFLNLCGNFFVRNIIFNNGCFYSLVLAEFDRRVENNFRGEGRPARILR